MASTIAKPYAKALLEVAEASRTLPATNKELSTFANMVRRSPELQVVLSAPTVPAAERKAVVKDLALRARASKTTTNFLCLLSDKGRISAVVDIADEFGALTDARSGVVRAQIESSAALSMPQTEKLRRALEGVTGKKVKVESQVLPELLGGVRIRVEGRTYDGSIQTQFKNLRESILRDL